MFRRKFLSCLRAAGPGGVRRISSTKVFSDWPKEPSDFRYEMAKLEHSKMYLDFMAEHFFPRNELYRGVRLNPKDPTLRRFMEIKINEWIPSNVSVVAIHEPNNEIAGIGFSTILTRDKRFMFDVTTMEVCSEPLKKYKKVIGHLERAVDVFADPKINTVLGMATMAMNPKYSGIDVSYAIIKEGGRLSKQAGCQVAVGQSTNVITQVMLGNLNCKQHYSIDFDTFTMEGERPLDSSLMDGTTKAAVYVIPIDETNEYMAKL